MTDQSIIEYKRVVLPLLKDGRYFDAFKASLNALKGVQKALQKTLPNLVARVVSLHNAITALSNSSLAAAPVEVTDREQTKLIAQVDALAPEVTVTLSQPAEKQPEPSIVVYKAEVMPLLKDGRYLDAFKASLKALKGVQKSLQKTFPNLVARVVSLHNAITALNNRSMAAAPVEETDREQAKLVAQLETL